MIPANFIIMGKKWIAWQNSTLSTFFHTINILSISKIAKPTSFPQKYMLQGTKIGLFDVMPFSPENTFFSLDFTKYDEYIDNKPLSLIYPIKLTN